MARGVDDDLGAEVGGEQRQVVPRPDAEGESDAALREGVGGEAPSQFFRQLLQFRSEGGGGS